VHIPFGTHDLESAERQKSGVFSPKRVFRGVVGTILLLSTLAVGVSGGTPVVP